MTQPTRALRLAPLLLTLGVSSCIERPYDSNGNGSAAPSAAAASRGPFDRASVRDALVAQVPPDAVPVGAVFGGAAELVAYRVEPSVVVPNGKMRLTFYWRCRKQLEDWHIFVHLDDATGQTPDRIHAEHDPVLGRFRTGDWRPGDLIADPVVVQAGKSPIAIFLGFYSDGESRLSLDTPGRGRDDGNNRLFVGTIPIGQ
jgi:hypothetical protein